MKIITFITNARYIDYANNLIKSGRQFGYKIELITSKTLNPHSWSEAILEKVKVINQCYQNNQPLVYLDADCLIQKPLDEFHFWLNNHNLLIRYRKDHVNPYQCGVMGFSPGMNNFLATWLKRTKKQFGEHKTVDQEILCDLLQNDGPFSKISIKDIGPYYNFTEHDAIELNKSKAHILHLKASKFNDHARAWFKKWMKKYPQTNLDKIPPSDAQNQ